MVVTSRSSSSSRRFCSSSSSSLEPSSSSPLFTKRSKVKIDTAIEYVRDGGNGGVFIGERGSIDNQGPVSDPGSESGELELGSSYPQDMDAEKPMSVMEISLEADTNPETDVLPTPTIPGLVAQTVLEKIYSKHKCPPINDESRQRLPSIPAELAFDLLKKAFNSGYGESLHILPQLLALSELEFNKAFLGMCLCLQVKITAEEIQGWKDLSIVAFEVAVWEHLGKDYCSPTDRRLSLDWDTGKTHHYYQCHVASDGSYTFKVHFTTLQLLYFVLVRTIESLTRCACRQCFDRDFFLSLEPVGTYLQKVLGDDNVLTVVFEDLQKNSSTCSIDPYSAYKRIAKNGIKIGFSLILSKTKKLEVDMTGITFEIIDDIHCHVLC
ncbi:hypothetical protein YC2023_124135 [Brassica napus]